MWTPQSEELSRSTGWHTVAEQQALCDAVVAVGGAGAASAPLALSLAREGVQRFRFADPDVIERSNFNRHPCASNNTLGQNKAEALADMIHGINQATVVEVYPEGVTRENVREFVKGADLVFDGIDFNSLAASVRLHVAARRHRIPVLTGLEIGPSAMVTSFMPDGVTFEETNGYDPIDPMGSKESIERSIEQIAKAAENGPDIAKAVPYLPINSSRLSVMKAVLMGAPLPTKGSGVNLLASITFEEAFNHLTSGAESSEPDWAHILRRITGRQRGGDNRPLPTVAPHYRVIDLNRNKAMVGRPSILRFTRSAMVLALRSMWNLNPDVVYDPGDEE
ncbi:MAG TPA: ThiF family adenylyltransferase [Candidatus Saccharimonadales bacterium]|nr:ThiF family adenylyltransferase [Candidatus Saccharimonadales bacterium]